MKSTHSQTQCQKLSAPKSGVHGGQYRRGQVVAKVGQGRKQFLLTILAPSVSRCASLAHRGITRVECGSEPCLLLLVKKTDLWSTIDPWLVYPANGVVR